MFTWRVLASAPLHLHKGKILEAFFITKLKPDLNDQIEHHTLSLFRMGLLELINDTSFYVMFFYIFIFSTSNSTN